VNFPRSLSVSGRLALWVLRFILATRQRDRSDGTPGRSADGKGDEDSEGGHQKLRLPTIRSASRSHHPIINPATQAPIATPIPTPSAAPTPNTIQVMVPPYRGPVVAPDEDMRMTTAGPSRCGKASDFGSLSLTGRARWRRRTCEPRRAEPRDSRDRDRYNNNSRATAVGAAIGRC
jgi:hypothetical protein